MKSDLNYRRDTVEGNFTFWHENGQKSEEGTKKKNLNVGDYSTWFENGQMASKSHFDEHGKAQGPQVKWHVNGQKAIEENFQNGVREGETRFWDSEGKLYVTRFFKNGVDVNLPASYKAKTGEKLELSVDGKYQMSSLEFYFTTSFWKTTSGEFEVTQEMLKFSGLRGYFGLRKFTADTIIVDRYGSKVVFVNEKKLQRSN